MTYDSIIFDFDGVLIDSAFDGYGWADRVTRSKAEELGYEVDEHVTPYLFSSRSYAELREQVADSRFTMDEYVRIEQAVAAKKIELVEDGVIPLIEGAHDVLAELDDRGVPMAVASNGYGEALGPIIKHLGFDRHLAFWTAPRLEAIEDYPGLRKPSPTLLERAIDALGAEEPLMVGDSRVDIEAAHNCGIDAALITTRDEPPEDVDPEHRIDRLDELVQLTDRSGTAP